MGTNISTGNITYKTQTMSNDRKRVKNKTLSAVSSQTVGRPFKNEYLSPSDTNTLFIMLKQNVSDLNTIVVIG